MIENIKVNASGNMEIGGCDTVELADEYGTPLYVLDEMSRVQNNEQQRTQASHQNAVQTTEKQSESNTRQVNSREETHNTAIREKQQNCYGKCNPASFIRPAGIN
jgi:alanyl-tRNA synthetase